MTKCNSTICAQGCFITCLAMAQRFYGIDLTATPITVDEALGSEGYSGCLALWSALPNALGLKIVKSTTNETEVRQWLQEGKICFAEIAPSSYQHFVMVTRYTSGKYWMYDPYKNINGYLHELYPNGAEAWRLIEKLKDEPEPTGRISLSFHVQEGNFWDYGKDKPTWLGQYLVDTGCGVAKVVDGVERCKEVKLIDADIITVARYFMGNDYDKYLKHAGGAYAGAKLFYAQIGDSLEANAEWVDGVEGPNEIIATDDEEGTKRSVAFYEQFCRVLGEYGYPARPVTLTAGVGNPQHGHETELLIPAARATANAKGWIGYHAYFGCRAKDHYCTMDDAWRHYGGRALESWDPTFVAAGIYCRYIFTECGAVYVAENGSMPSSSAGWKYKETCNGDWAWYKSLLIEFNRRLMKHGRVDGALIFTLGNWPNFTLNEQQVGELAVALKRSLA